MQVRSRCTVPWMVDDDVILRDLLFRRDVVAVAFSCVEGSISVAD